MVLECVGEEIGPPDLFEAYLRHERGCLLVTGVVAEDVHLKWLSAVEILRIDLSGAEAGDHDLCVLRFLAAGLENNHFLILYIGSGFGRVLHQVEGDNLARYFGVLGGRGDRTCHDGGGCQQSFCSSWQWRFLVDQAIGNGSVAVDTAVTQEGPVATDVFQGLHVDLPDQDFFAVVRALGKNTTEWIAEERSAPEFEALPGSRFPADVAGFESHAIDDGDIYSVGDGVGPLDRAPGVMLSHSRLRFFRRMPADCRRIKQNLGALQRGEPRALGIPLIPTDQRSQFARAGLERAEAEISGSEIELFVIEGVVRDVHLAVETAERSVFIEDGCRIVVHARGAFFKEGCNQDNSIFAGCSGQCFATRARDRFGKIEERVVFTLAKILGLEKFRQTDDLRASSRGVGDAAERLFEILLWLRAARHLDQGYAIFFRRHARPPRDQYSIQGTVASFSLLASIGLGDRKTLGALRWLR